MSQHHRKWNEYYEDHYFFDTEEAALEFANDPDRPAKSIEVFLINIPDSFNDVEASSNHFEFLFNHEDEFDAYKFLEKHGQFLKEVVTDGWIDFSHEPEIAGIIHCGDFLGDIVNGKITIHLKPDRTHITNLTIPTMICNLHECFDVVKIKEKAFSNLEHLEEVIIENNEIEIGAGAFEGCRKLKPLIYREFPTVTEEFPTSTYIELRGTKEKIENALNEVRIYDERDPSKYRLDLKAFYNTKYWDLAGLFSWQPAGPELVIFPRKEGDIGIISFVAENSNIQDGVMELSLRHPDIVFHYIFKSPNGEHDDDSLFQNGRFIEQ
jgi:hypothetical protein